MTTSAPPKVLIVGQRFDGRTGGGITLSSLFSTFPPDSLGVAAYSPLSGELAVCDSYFLFGPEEDAILWPFSLGRSVPSLHGPLPPNSQPYEVSTADVLAPRAAARARKKAHAALLALGLEPCIRSLSLSPRLIEWVRELRPGVIYSQLSSLPLVRLVTNLADASGVPLVLHFMDDWPPTAYTTGPFEKRVRRTLLRELPLLVDRAAAALAIGEDMAAAFSARYGRDFGWFQNCVDLKTWEPHQKRRWRRDGTFRFAYTGRVGTANESSIGTLCRVVSEMAQSGMDVELVLGTTEKSGRVVEGVRRLPGITVQAPVPHADMPAFLSSFDALLLSLDFDARSVAFARYSMPTKLPEYLASGVPVLAYLPSTSSLAKYLRDRQCAFVVTTPELNAVQGGLLELMQSENLREEIGRRGLQVASTEHDAKHVSDRFLGTLMGVACSPRPQPWGCPETR